MSSTNRGSERNKDDLYETPEWFTESIIPELKSRLDHVTDTLQIYEPAAGKGKMLRVLQKSFPDACIDHSDLNYDPSVDFLTLDPRQEYDLIVTNPPFLRAQEFVEQALKFRRNTKAVVAMVLRLNFLGSKKRASWLREYLPSVYVSPKRPSFTSDGKTDSPEYAWLLWQEPFKFTSKLDILRTEHIVTRRKKKKSVTPV